MQGPVTTQDLPSTPELSPPHPEEMAAGFNLRLGDKFVLQSKARATPAGIIAAGLTASAILLSVGHMVRAMRKRG
jgi:hypothetical protein